MITDQMVQVLGGLGSKEGVRAAQLDTEYFHQVADEAVQGEQTEVECEVRCGNALTDADNKYDNPSSGTELGRRRSAQKC